MSINIYDAPGGPSGYMLKSYYFLPEGGSKYRFVHPSLGVIQTGLKNNDSCSWSVGSPPANVTWTISKLAFTAGTPEKASGNWKLVTGLLTGESGDEPDAEEEGTFVAQAGGRIGEEPPTDNAASSASA